MKYLIILFLLLPIFILWSGRQWPEIMLGNELSLVWSFLGTFVSYMGLFFSFYAVMEVKKLSNRYFAKQRLPEIKKQLEGITKSMTSHANSKLIDIRAERFLGETAVMLRHLKKIKASGFTEVVKRAEIHHSNIEKLLKNHVEPDKNVNDEAEYWNLFRVLSELADEIEAYNKGAQASL